MPSTTELVLRIVAAAIAGLVIGFDRDWKDKPVDFRAYAIVSATSAMIAVAGLQLINDVHNPDKAMGMDPLRIFQSVMMSIGFLGGGVIMKQEGKVIGTATAASIWAAAGMGVTIGIGYYRFALAEFICILVLLVVFGWLMPLMDDSRDNRRK